MGRPTAETLPIDLRARLDQADLKPLVEYFGERVGADTGNRYLKFHLENGRLQETSIDHARISNGELEALAKP